MPATVTANAHTVRLHKGCAVPCTGILKRSYSSVIHTLLNACQGNGRYFQRLLGALSRKFSRNSLGTGLFYSISLLYSAYVFIILISTVVRVPDDDSVMN